MPEITWVQRVDKNGQPMTLEQNCLENKMLPSLAYGFKKCSHKFKIQPQEKYVNNWQPAKEVWKSKGKVVKLIGFDADEPQRASITEDPRSYPRAKCGGKIKKSRAQSLKHKGILFPRDLKK